MHSESLGGKKKGKRLQDFLFFGPKKGADLKGGQQRKTFVLSLRLHPQSRVLISYCFRPKQRQRSRRSKQMTIKLSNKHHPAMFPNADCGRARRESESGGSRIVSSHFDAELKKLAKKTGKKDREEESNVCHERRRGKAEEWEGERGRSKEGEKKHGKSICIRAPAFVSLAVRRITFIEPDRELKSRPGVAFEAAKRLLRLFAP